MAKVKINFPKQLWTKKDTMKLAMNTLASIKLRTSKGLDADEQPFKDYSENPIYISLDKGTGARLKPKGGRLSRTGQSMFFKDGYKEYKDKSRKRGRRNKNQDDSAEVDLVLSGALMNNLVVINAEQTYFRIGLTANVRHYGYHVNKEREFIGLSSKDVQILTETVKEEIAKKVDKGAKQ